MLGGLSFFPMKLLFFIVCSKAFGSRVLSQRHSIRTRMNDHFQTEAYQCRDYAEFQMLQPIVAKQSSTLWCAVRCQDAQGQLHLPTEDMIIGRFPIDEIQGALEAGGAHIPAEEGSIPSPVTVVETPVVPPQVEELPPEQFDLGGRIMQMVEGRSRKLAEIAAELNVPAAEIKALLQTHPTLRLKQGGWVSH